MKRLLYAMALSLFVAVSVQAQEKGYLTGSFESNDNL